MAQRELQAKREEKEHDTLTKYLIKGYETPPPALQELLTLEARNTTLLALGGPDGNTVDPHGNWWASHPTVLAKALRGAWRWWLRTLLQHEYKAENYQKLWEKEEELGLGSTSQATCYIIEVELIEPEKISGTPLSAEEIRKTLVEIIDEEKLEKRKEDLLCDLGRGKKRKVTLRIDEDIVKEKHENYTEKLVTYMLTKLRYYVLLTMPYKLTFKQHNRRELENLTPEKLVQKLVYRGEHLHEFLYRKQPLLPGQLTIKVTLYRRKACNTQIDDDLAKKALFYALIIGGIGAATTRGFGKFTIIKDREAQQIQREILQQYRLDKQDIELTPLPDIYKAVKIMIQPPETWDLLDILAKITDVVRKYEWKVTAQRLGIPRNSTKKEREKEHGGIYHTWVLGLPRSMRKRFKDKIIIISGYYIKKYNKENKIERWKSPFIFTPVQEDANEDNNNWKILVTLFPLKDAELLLHTRSYQLYWKGKYTNKEVRKLNLLSPSGQLELNAENAYRAALKWITEILEGR